MTEIRDLKIAGIKAIRPKRFGDERGFFSETYRDDWALLEAGSFVQDNHAFSATPGTIRGLHFQTGRSTQAKLLRVVTGAILDVAVDIRKGSPSYGRYVAERLTATGGEQLFVPHGFAHGYQVLEPDTHVLYKVDHLYDPEREGAVLWSDVAIGIEWADMAPILSKKDENAAPLHELDTPFVYDADAPYNCRCLEI